MLPSMTDASSQFGDSIKQYHKQPSIFRRTQKGENSARDPAESRKTPSQTVFDGPVSIQEQIKKADSQSRLSKQIQDSQKTVTGAVEAVDQPGKPVPVRPKLAIQDFDNTPQNYAETSRTQTMFADGVSLKLANLITVMQTDFYKALPKKTQITFKQLFDYAQRLECIIQEKDEEIQRLMFLNKYHYKIQEKKDHMYTKLVEQNRNIVEENKKFAKSKKGFLSESKTANSVRITRNSKLIRTSLDQMPQIPTQPSPQATQTAVPPNMPNLSPKSQGKKIQLVQQLVQPTETADAQQALPNRSSSPSPTNKMSSFRTEAQKSRHNSQFTTLPQTSAVPVAGGASPYSVNASPGSPGNTSPAALPGKVSDSRLKIKRYEAKPTLISRDVSTLL